MNDELRVQQLKTKIQELKAVVWPMEGADEVEGLPLYWASNEAVEAYLKEWRPLLVEAREIYAPLIDDGSEIAIPTHLEIPLIFTNVERIIINKSKAKESKTFRGVAALIEKCGQFDQNQIEVMRQWIESDDNAALVAHREFIDLRSYIFIRGREEYIRSRFYTHGLLLGVLPEFKITDNRGKARKERNDSFKDPLAENENWKIYAKYR